MQDLNYTEIHISELIFNCMNEETKDVYEKVFENDSDKPFFIVAFRGIIKSETQIMIDEGKQVDTFCNLKNVMQYVYKMIQLQKGIEIT